MTTKETNSSTSRKWFWISLAVATVIAGSYIYFADRRVKNTNHSGEVHLVAAENFWGSIAAQIGKNHVTVTSIITDPSADPHLYESDAHDAAALSSADIVIENGLGYDDFMDKLMSASPNNHRVVLSAEKILGASSDANPHLWYDIPRVHIVASALESEMVTKDPAHKSEYAQNLTDFEKSLQPILDTILKIKTKYPAVPVAYTERVPGYLLADAGLSVKTPVGFAGAIEEGNDPSPADTQAMQSLITGHSVKVLLYNAQATSSVTQHIRDLANQNGIPVIGVTETLPKDEPSYSSWQLDQTKALLKALGG